MKIFKTLVTAALLTLAFMVFAPSKADAAVQDLNGWAWSSNVGWISFNCLTGGSCGTSDYKVRLDDQTGAMSGYAWSSNVGWISFNAADISGCAPNATSPNINTKTGFAVGWARVLVPKTTSDPYWNGCIALSGKDFTSPDVSGNRGVTYDVTDKKIKGHAWGSNVIGWIKFLDVLCAGCTDTVNPSPSDFTVQANSVTLSNVSGSTVSTPVNVTRLGLNDVGVSNITLSGLPANVTASWTRNGTAVAGNRSCVTTLPTAPGPCAFSLTLTSGATAPLVGTYSVVATAVSTSTPSYSRSETFTLAITDNPGSTRDYSVSVGDVTMLQTAGTKASTQVILTRVGTTDVGIANVTIDSGLPTGINVTPRWYRSGTLVDPRSCASTAVGACQFVLEFTAEPGEATAGVYNLQLKSTSTGVPVITKYTSMRLTVTKVNNPITLDFTVQANSATLSSAPGSTVTTPVSVTRLGLNDVGVSNITLSGLPANVTASWQKNGAAVAGNRSCASTLPTAPGPCAFDLVLASNSLGSIPGTYTVTATAVSNSVPSFSRSEDFTLVVKGVPPPGERDYSVSVGDVTMVQTRGTKASTQVIFNKTGTIDVGITNVTIDSGLTTGMNVEPRWYQNGTQVDPRACASTASSACQFFLEFTAEPGDAVVGTYTLQLRSVSTGSPAIIKYTEMTLTILPGPSGSTSDFGITSTDQISMEKAAGSSVSTTVTVTKIGSNDVGLSNLVVSGLPQNVTASWRYPDGTVVSGRRSCISTTLNACRFVLRLTATAAIPPGTSGSFPSTFPLVITGTSATSPSFNRVKNVSLEVTDPTVNPTTPTVTLKVNDKFTASSPNNVVVIGSKNNKVEWARGGVGVFSQGCSISSNPVNPLWNGARFDSTYDSYAQTGVTINQKTVFSVVCTNNGADQTSSVTVDVTASPDFREF
jgi:hypothetical protein